LEYPFVMAINKNHFKHYPLIGIFIFLSCSSAFSQSLPDDTLVKERSTLKEQKNQEGYIINLKDLINRSKKKIEEVNVKIEEQAKRRRNQQREEKAREYYEQAMRLSYEGKLDQAQELWQKAIKITEHPEMKGYISESVVKTKKEQSALQDAQQRRIKRLEVERGYSAEEVEKKYQEGVSLYKQKKLKPAQEAFERVEDMFPDHKATRSYLMIIEQEILKEQQKVMDQKLKQEMQARQKAKEEWRKELEKREQERQKFLDDQAETIYQDAVKLYRAREFEKAKERFKEVEWVYPNYKSTPYFLSGIDNDIRQEEKRKELERRRELERQMEESKVSKKLEQERQLKIRKQEEENRINRLKEEAEFTYKDGIALYKKGEYREAREKFVKVNKQFPSYKQAVMYIKQIDTEIENQNKLEAEKKQKIFELQMKQERLEKERIAEEQRRRFQQDQKSEIERLQKEAELIYKTAVSLFDHGLYAQSQEKFLQLEKLYPSYKLSKNYLKKIDAQFQAERRKEEQNLILEKRRAEEESRQKRDSERLSQARRERAQELTRQEKEESLKKQAEILYRSALALYDSNLYFQAKEKFLELESFYPNYKFTTRYLKFLERKIVENAPTEDVWDAVRRRKADISSEEDEAVKKAIEERRQKMSQEAEMKYQEALHFYKNKKLVEAQRKFIQVEALYPEYKDTLKYLSLIDDELSLGDKIGPSSKKRMSPIEAKQFSEVTGPVAAVLTKKEIILEEKNIEDIEAIYQEAVRNFNKKDYKIALEKFEDVNRLKWGYKSTARYLAQSAKKIKELEENSALNEKIAKAQEDSERLKEKKEQKARDVFSKKAEQYYQQGLKLFQRNRFEEAKNKFVEVQSYEENYKDTRSYLNLIDEKIIEQGQQQKREKQQTQAEEIYQTAMRYYKNKKYAQAKDKFLEVQALEVGYKETVKFLKLIDEKIEAQQAKQNHCLDACVHDCMERCLGIVESERVEKIIPQIQAQVCAAPPSCYDLTDEAEEIYRSAVGIYKRGAYQQAKARFQEVQLLIARYRNTESYLRVIDRKLEQQYQKDKKEDVLGVTEKRKESVNREQKLRKEVEAKKESWEIGIEQRLAMLRAKEKQMDSLKGQAKEQYQKEIQRERQALAELRKKFLQQEKQRKKEIQARLNEEKKKERLAKGAQERLALQKQKELEAALKIEQEQKKQLELKKRQDSEKNKPLLEKEKNDEQKDLKEKEKLGESIKIADAQDKASAEAKPSVVETYEYQRYKEELEKERVKKEYEQYLKKQRNLERKQEEGFAKARKQRKKEELSRREELKKELSREAGILFQEGVKLYQQGLFEEARAKFVAAEGMYPGYKSASNYIVKCEEQLIKQEVVSQEKRSSEKTQEKTQEIETLYREALQAYRYQDYPVAKEKFEAVFKIDAEYKSARNYLAECEKRLLAEERRKKEQEGKFKDKQKSDPAKAEDLDFKEQKTKEFSQEQKNVPEVIFEEKDVEVLYQEALSFYKVQEYEKAIFVFTELEKMNPDYKKTKEYLKKSNELVVVQKQRQQKEKEARDLLRKKENLKNAKKDVESYYTEVVAAYKSQDKQAQEKLKQFDEMLLKNDLPEDYVQSMKLKIQKELDRVKKSIDQEQEKKARLEKPYLDKINREKKKELEKLEKEIRLEEERLLKEKKMQEQKNILKEEESSDVPSRAPQKKKPQEDVLKRDQEERIAKKYVEALRDQKRIALEKEQKEKKEREEVLETRRLEEKQKRDEIARMVKERQKQLEQEREQIRKNFSERLEGLYQTAEKLYRQGSYRYAGHMFQEIETMAADYKKTRSYLKDIFKKVSAESLQYPQTYSPSSAAPTRNIVDEALDAVSVERPR